MRGIEHELVAIVGACMAGNLERAVENPHGDIGSHQGQLPSDGFRRVWLGDRAIQQTAHWSGTRVRLIRPRGRVEGIQAVVYGTVSRSGVLSSDRGLVE